MRSLGADHVVDYTTTDATDGSTAYDLIIDTGDLDRATSEGTNRLIAG